MPSPKLTDDQLTELVRGKVVQSLTRDGDDLLMEFEDGSQTKFELVATNTECHCHPHYVYSIGVELYA